uniref:Ig-like domain-containing protein n=1 Tax=Amphiprion percula TaxID=161767 RepID=A0A3P8TB12_AMPPE
EVSWSLPDGTLINNVASLAEKPSFAVPNIEILPIKQDGGMKITYGLSLNLPCTVDGWPQASITWTLPNGVVLDKPQTTGRISFLTNGTLQLRQVATFDKGTYICKASNTFGSSTLSYPVAVMVFPPQITSILTSITRVNRGSPVTLKCDATGIPKPDISWTLPGRTTLVPHNRYTVQGGIHMTEEGSLVIQNPVLMNSGIYKCNAKNALGTDFKSTGDLACDTIHCSFKWGLFSKYSSFAISNSRFVFYVANTGVFDKCLFTC